MSVPPQNDRKPQKVKTLSSDAKAHGVMADDGVVFKDDASDTYHSPEPVATPSQKQHGGNSILTNKDDVFDVSRAFETRSERGTIVTDRKRKKYTLWGALKGAFSEWAGDIKETTEKVSDHFETPEEATVATPESRAAVIKKAGTHAAQRPSDDHEIVIEKLRTLKHDAESVTGRPYAIKTSAETETPHWSHTKTDPQSDEQSKPTLPLAATAPEQSSKPEAPPKPRAARTDAPTPKKTPRGEAPATAASDARFIPHNLPTAQGPQAGAIPDIKSEAAQPERRQQASEQKPRAPEPDLEHIHSEGTEVTQKEEAPSPDAPRWASERDMPEQKQQPDTASSEPATPTETEAPRRKETEPAPAAAPEQQATPVIQQRNPDRTHAAPEPAREPTEEAPTTPPQPEARPQPQRVRVAPQQQAPRETMSDQLSPRTLLAGIIGVAILGGMTAAYLIFGPIAFSPEAQAPAEAPRLVPATASAPVDLTSDREVFLTALTDSIRNTDGAITQIYPVTIDPETGIERPATSEEIMGVIEPRVPGSFLRSLAPELTFGGVGEAQTPYIVLKTTDFEAAFAGMLAWEGRIMADLAPLFGQPVTRSFDPDARTADRTRPATYVDRAVANYDVRALTDENDQGRLLYTFVDSETLIITRTPQALTAIVDAL